MPTNDLYDLYKLHVVDAAIADIKKRAASLDPGREVKPLLDAVKPGYDAAKAKYDALASELKDLEYRTQTIDEKLKKLDKELYGGKVVSPKEIQAYEHEIATLKAKRDQDAPRMLELFDLVPAAKAEFDEWDKKLSVIKGKYAEAKARALETKAELEREYKEKMAERPGLVAKIDKGHLAQYEAIRAKHEGIGMALVTERGTCERCGVQLPTKTIEMAKEDKWITCEECHRILFHMVPKV